MDHQAFGEGMSKAYVYLRELLDGYDENLPQNSAALTKMKQRFSALLEDDYQTADLDERKKLKALSVAADHFFDATQGVRSQVRLDTFNDLVGIATGMRGSNGLSPLTPRRRQRTAEEDWQIARAIVAMRRGLDAGPHFKKWLAGKTGKTPDQLRKLMDNIDQEKGPYDTIKVNIAEIERRHDAGESWIYDDLNA
jgi:hypothetical protein